MTVRQTAPLAALVVTAAVIVAIISGGSGEGHRITLKTTDATGVLSGQDVRLAGSKVGRVTAVEAIEDGRAARIELRLDDVAWPVRTGSRFTVRWGGTVSYLKRYIALRPGPASAPAIRDGSALPASALVTPVDFDALINQFGPRVRGSISAFLDRGGATLLRSSPDVRRVLDRTPGALMQSSALLREVVTSQSDLRALLTSTGRVVTALETADPSIDQAVHGAARTFAATARRTDEIRRTLVAAPRTLSKARATLGRADRTLDLARSATARIAPGVEQLQRTVAPVNQLLRQVVRVGPDARSTLVTARRSAPAVTRLLERTGELLPTIDSVVTQANAQLRCIRPYTPELASMGTNWSGFISAVDDRDYYARVAPAALTFAPTNAESKSVGEVVRDFPGVTVGFPRPPGTVAGQPWFLPECGAGRDALDPFKDAEARVRSKP